MESTQITILLVEDDLSTGNLHEEKLKKSGYNIVRMHPGNVSVESLNKKVTPDLALIDLVPGKGKDSAGAAREISGKQNIPVIFITSPEDEDALSVISDIPSYGFVPKNSGTIHLDTAIKSALNLHKMNNRRITDNGDTRYKDLVDNAGEAIFVAQDGMLKLFNPATCELTGKTEQELYSTPFIDLIHPEDRDMVMNNHLKRTAGAYAPARYLFRMLTKDNYIKWVEINSILYRWDKKPATLNFLTNVTERKEIEDALREKEIKYRKIFENVQDVFYQTDIQGKIIEISPSITRYSGFSRDELIGRPVSEVYSNPDDRAELINTIREKGEAIDYELILQNKDKKIIFTSTNSHFMYNSEGEITGIEGSLRDITARKEAEFALKESLRQKELLMIELQHRIKNNLGIISSLLTLEMPRLKDEHAREIFMNAKTRILSMSGIYEQLYSSGNFEEVNLAEYIKNLAGIIMKTYSVKSRHLSLVSNIAPVHLDLKRTVPLGLILNELITNTLKYAYHEGEEGDISIELTENNGQITMTVSDKGAGLPEGFDIKKSDTMGLSLVNMLAEQLNGNMKTANNGGTKISISFKL